MKKLRIKIKITHITICARDDYPLAATIYHPHNPSKNFVVINSAMAVLRKFYKHFAIDLAKAGYTTITYDYRGIGDSKHESLRNMSTTLWDWALKDMAGVIDWVASEFSPEKLFLIGHSMGPSDIINSNPLQAELQE